MDIKLKVENQEDGFLERSSIGFDKDRHYLTYRELENGVIETGFFDFVDYCQATKDHYFVRKTVTFIDMYTTS